MLTEELIGSSGMVALHQGIQSLRTHEADLSIVGGANLTLNPDMFKALSSSGLVHNSHNTKLGESKKDVERLMTHFRQDSYPEMENATPLIPVQVDTDAARVWRRC
jgi:3-oxoacyl-(acyl-carrier-protein) synthase